MAEEIRHATLEDDKMGALSTCVIHGWPSTRTEVIKEQPYLSFRDEVVVIDGIAIKGRIRKISPSLWKRVWDQLHVNHMGIGRTRLLACNSFYWYILMLTW